MFFETSDFAVNDINVYKTGWKSHDAVSALRPYHAISFRIKGAAEFVHENDRIEVKTGDILFVPAYYRYSIHSADEELYVIHFTSDVPMPQHFKKISPQNYEYFLRLFIDIYNIWNRKQAYCEHECRSIFYRIAADIEREYTSYTSGNNKLPTVMDYIHNNFTDPDFSVNSIAQHYGMSDTYFRRVFKNEFSVTPIQYINALKTDLAVKLLASGYFTVNEVADKCGFSGTYYFSAFIKRETGFPPTHFIRGK